MVEERPHKQMVLDPARDEFGGTKVVGLQAQPTTFIGVGISDFDQAVRPTGREDRGVLANSLNKEAVGLVEVGHFTDRGVQLRGERLGVIVLQRSNVDLF